MASTNPLALGATIVLLFPMVYFMIATLTFFLAKLSDPIVTWMLRGLFDFYFRAVAALCTVGALAYAWAESLRVSLGLLAVVGVALMARRWFLVELDRQITARDSGDPRATAHLRRLHVAGVLYNLMQLGAIVISVPSMLAVAS